VVQEKDYKGWRNDCKVNTSADKQTLITSANP